MMIGQSGCTLFRSFSSQLSFCAEFRFKAPCPVLSCPARIDKEGLCGRTSAGRQAGRHRANRSGTLPDSGIISCTLRKTPLDLMSFLTENSVHCWKGVSSRNPGPYFDRRSSLDAPSFDPHVAMGAKDKGMQVGGSVVQRLTSLAIRPSRYVLQGPRLIPQQVSNLDTKVRQSVTSSAQATHQDRGQSSRSAHMGEDITRPIEQILPALKEIVPSLSAGRHKGQAGKIGVIGGCREYTGAPYYAAISALKLGADLSHVFCTEGAATVIKSYSPELIVHPVLRESHEARTGWETLREKVVGDVEKWLDRFDCLVIGPGLGRDDFVLECVQHIIQVARAKNTPMVIDGDGLFIITHVPGLVIGYPLAVLTPNVNEHKRLVARMMDEQKDVPEDLAGQLLLLAQKMAGVTIIQKGKQDLISDGQSDAGPGIALCHKICYDSYQFLVFASDYFGSPRRCGGQGDVLSGSTAVFVAWARQYFQNNKDATVSMKSICGNPAVIGGLAGSLLLRKAAADAFAKHKRSTLTTDIIESLGPSMEQFFPVEV